MSYLKPREAKSAFAFYSGLAESRIESFVTPSGDCTMMVLYYNDVRIATKLFVVEESSGKKTFKEEYY